MKTITQEAVMRMKAHLFALCA
ncbi:MAG: hypothetical protein H6Q81_2654, partial [Deltaproteobacteria bacterium]|nr:hypothetical protein [Deltaproteobacteria bacterium]